MLISSAPDLQIRLANDGYALSYASPYARGLPSWAVWRDEVYGFTFEPAVIVYNPRRFSEATAPRSRQALLRLLEQEGASLRGRVGTYDIAASNVGYVLAEQDELVSSNFWGLANALGQVGVRLATNSGELLDAIERGELDLGYNLLGSYALARQAAGEAIGVILPQDYMLVLARSVLIARRAPNPDLGRAWWIGCCRRRGSKWPPTMRPWARWCRARPAPGRPMRCRRGRAASCSPSCSVRRCWSDWTSSGNPALCRTGCGW